MSTMSLDVSAAYVLKFSKEKYRVCVFADVPSFQPMIIDQLLQVLLPLLKALITQFPLTARKPVF